MDDCELRNWIGRTEVSSEPASLLLFERLAATLDQNAEGLVAGMSVPVLWHWALFTPRTPASGIGGDGHARRGGFLPPIGAPRRMFAGSHVEVSRPLTIGASIVSETKIADVKCKSGRSGDLVFLTLLKRFSDDGGVAVVETQDIVYQQNAPGPVQQPTPSAMLPVQGIVEAPWQRDFTPDPVMLFRFSAATFNAHRIHYDQSYARDIEGYRGLIVHGPLTALLLVDLCRRHNPESRVADFSFRAKEPLFAGEPLRLRGWPEKVGARLVAYTPEGREAVEAHIRFGEHGSPLGAPSADGFL